MVDLNSNIIPKEATQALEIILDLFESTVMGVYLYGSAVMGGLRVNSDLAILLAQARKSSVSLFGPKASDILEGVPMTDILK